MNPELVICRMERSVKLDLELMVAKGRGYVPAEENEVSEAPIGTIAMDAIFTPIKNVRYSVENTRVEQRTDYEKLIVEIKTDGTIHTEDAIKGESRILIQHLMLISDVNIMKQRTEGRDGG
jgi:DNA-directed RNA polymerase subunit alpha